MMAAPTGAGFVRIDSLMGSHRCAFETVAACETRPTVRYDDKSNTHYVEYLIMMYPGDGAAPFEIAQVRAGGWAERGRGNEDRPGGCSIPKDWLAD